MKKPEKVTIRQLIDSRKVFVVPKYQRTYAWEDEEIDDFIKDISNCYGVRISQNAQCMEHFLGGFVTIEEDEPDIQPSHKYQVVDGQQRMSTFLIGLSLLVQAFEELENEATDSEDKKKARNFAKNTRKYLTYERLNNLTGDETNPVRLTLSSTDRDFFEKILRGEIKPDIDVKKEVASHERLSYAYARIGIELVDNISNDNNLTVTGKIDRLIKLQQALLDDCYVIHIISETLSEGYRLFAILNDRGQRLTDADLLRSHTLSLLEGNPVQSRVEKYWDHLAEGKFEDIDGFLRSYYVSCEGKRPSRGGLYDDYKKSYFDYRIGTRVTDETEAQRIADKIESMSSEWDCYISLVNGTWPYQTAQVSDWHRKRIYLLVKTLRHDLCIPLLLSAVQKLDEKEFAALINVIERFYFRYKIILNEHMGAIGNIYYKYAKGIRDGIAKYSVSNLKAELKKKIMERADDALFKLKLPDELTYQERSTNRKNAIKYFLMTMEDYLQWYRQGASGEPRPNDRGDLDIARLTIDHVYPQSPQSPHPDMGDTKHKLGNLTLLGGSDNSSAGNKQPAEKKDVYRNENKISFTSSLVDRADNWDASAIDNRERELVKIALKVFTL